MQSSWLRLIAPSAVLLASALACEDASDLPPFDGSAGSAGLAGSASAGLGGGAGTAGTETNAGAGRAGVASTEGGSAGASATAGAGGVLGGAGGTAGSNAAGGTAGANSGNCGDTAKDGVLIYEDVTAETTWSCPLYTLTRPIFVHGTGPTQTVLHISAGVTVRGVKGNLDAAKLPGALIVARSGRLDAVGTAQNPIVFTSAQPTAMRAPGDWGGVVLLGRGYTNVPANYENSGNQSGQMFVEGLPRTELTTYGALNTIASAGAGGAGGAGGASAGSGGTSGASGGAGGTTAGVGGAAAGSGGTSGAAASAGAGGASNGVPVTAADPAWNCGTLKYARIEFAGFEVSSGKELNGLTIGACGRATQIDHVQVHRSSDDGVELFGGSVNLSYIVLTGEKDDALDWDQGWSGRAQFIAIQMHDDSALPAAQKGDSGIEADGWADPTTAQGEPSSPRIFNMTLLASKSSQRGIRLREGTQVFFGNSIFVSHAEGVVQGLVDIGDVATADWITAGKLKLENTILAGTWPTAGQKDKNGKLYLEADYFTTGAGSTGNTEIGSATAVLLNAFNEAKPGWVPLATSIAAENAATPDDPGAVTPFFDATAKFRGAFKPGGEDWTTAWTAYP